MEAINTQELISVIIPAYNEEKYILKSINSIRYQTYQNLEIVVVDDFSTDNTCLVVENVIKLDSRIKLIKKQSNDGPAICLNIGIKASNSENFIVRMDADDFVFPTKIERQYYLMKSNPEVVACGTAAYYINYRTNDNRLVIFPSDDYQIKKMLSFSDLIQSGSAMYRKQAIVQVDYFDEENPKAEAMRIALKLSKIGKFANLTTPEYVYFTRKGLGNRSAEGNYRKRNDAYAKITRKYFVEKLTFRAFIASVAWQLYHFIPRKLQVILRKVIFRKYINIPLDSIEVQTIERYFENL